MSDQVLDIFREEAREHLGALEKGFLDLESTAEVEPRRPLIDSLFRHAHSLKGDARAIGLNDLQQAAQILEDVLDALRENPELVDRAATDDGLAQLDRVRTTYEAWQTEAVSGQAPADEPAEGKAVGPRQPVSVPAEEPPGERTTGGESTPPAPSAERFTVRVPSERLDRMLNLAGELSIAQRATADITERLSDLRTHLECVLKSIVRGNSVEWRANVDSAINQVRRIETDLRKSRTHEELLIGSLEGDIRQARLLPLAMLADSLRRPLRDLAQSLGKQIRYDVYAGKVLLDKAVIEALKDPLLHLVRNAADHGIETPAARREAGKPEEGVVRINAQPRGEHVRIMVSDDGRGLDFGAIRDQVHTHESLSEQEIQTLTEQQLAEYLFQPGFTTAKVGDVSGRGVGLDVVQDTLHRLQGTVELVSSSPSGTAFEITVPVSISTVRIVSVMCGGQHYGVASATILRTGSADRSELRELEGTLVLSLDGQPVRWVALSDLLGMGTHRPKVNGTSGAYLLITHEGHRMAVAVDGLDEEREVLLKPLGFPLRGMPGVIGGTIRPDGTVQLVLDLSSAAFGHATPRVRTEPQQQHAAGVLVVDDSPTTRTIVRNLFTAAGYAVWTATDGIDALEKLRMHPVDVVVSDFEMPRLNGVDLTRRIKASMGLPVILVTAREKEEHRRLGLEAGADAYVVKSTFQGESLLDVVRQFV